MTILRVRILSRTTPSYKNSAVLFSRRSSLRVPSTIILRIEMIKLLHEIELSASPQVAKPTTNQHAIVHNYTVGPGLKSSS